MEYFKYVLIILFLTVPAFKYASAQDIKGSSDHPVISRYEGSVIKAYNQKEFDEYQLLLGKAHYATYPKTTSDNKKNLEGKVTRITYLNPAGRSTLEVFRNYKNELEKGGFNILFTCSDDECGGRAMNHAAVPKSAYIFMGENYDDQRYLDAELNRDKGRIYTAIYINSGPGKKVYSQVDVIEVEPMEEGMVTVDADAMEKEIASKGSVSIYGIYFTFDSADIKTESKPAIEQIAKLLKNIPELELFVVGHTDNKGSLEYNMSLSEKRAKSVVNKLVDEYDISSSRLTPKGLGFLAPVATNRTEEGRAKNRRVELVEK